MLTQCKCVVFLLIVIENELLYKRKLYSISDALLFIEPVQISSPETAVNTVRQDISNVPVKQKKIQPNMFKEELMVPTERKDHMHHEG